jgi:hypothetical protein
MQFADPEWQPHVTRDFNLEQAQPAPQPVWTPPSSADSSAQQSSETERDYAQGYRAQTPPFPDRAQPSQPPQAPPQAQSQAQQPFQFQPLRIQNIPGWVWWLVTALILAALAQPLLAGAHIFSVIFAGLIIVLIWLLLSKRITVNLSGERQAPETRTFTVSSNPKILINNKTGSIHVRAGKTEKVSITTTKRGYLFNQRLNRDSQIWYSQDQTANTISARVDQWKLFGKNAIDFEITVPPRASLELVTNLGNISVQNIAGQMKIQSDAGSISTTQVKLQGTSRMKTDAGSITFDGSLDSGGDYNMSTDLGSVTVNLPADASFRLDAKTDLGAVTTNLLLPQTQNTRASGKVGIGPYPHLKLRTDLGSVHVHRK